MENKARGKNVYLAPTKLLGLKIVLHMYTKFGHLTKCSPDVLESFIVSN